ncbi:MAG: hypothetical protein ABI175_09165, partial [Polyangiales bacterium]
AIPLARLAARLMARGAMTTGRWVTAGGLTLVVLIGLGTFAQRSSSKSAPATVSETTMSSPMSSTQPMAPRFHDDDGKDIAYKSPADETVSGKKLGGLQEEKLANDKTDGDFGALKDGEAYADLVTKATIDGVTPVALPLPRFERSVTVSRELVTDARPFSPTLIYVTDATLAVLALIGLLAGLSLVFLHREALFAVRDRIRTFLAERPIIVPAPPAAPAPVAPPAE